MTKILFFLFLLFLSVSCKKNPETVDFEFEYFPFKKGIYHEYDVTYIDHNPKSDTFYYRLKTVIGDTVIDNSGRVAREFFRYIYDTTTNMYKLKDVWTAIITDYRAEIVEENERMIKLVFAPTEEKEWDINAFNTYDPMIAYYEDLNSELETNGFQFDYTLKVVQQDEPGIFIQIKRKYEYYAKGVGLVGKYFKEIYYNEGDSLKPYDGTELYYKLVGYGKE